jgi:hypothetical protein
MLVTIPIAPGVPAQEQVTTLDGRAYRLTLRWNGRIERWFFDLETAAGEAIVRGKPLVLGADLLRQVRWNPAAPQGGLVLADPAGAEATLEALGSRAVLLYFGVG